MNTQQKLQRLTDAVRKSLPSLTEDGALSDERRRFLLETLSSALDAIGDKFDGTLTFATTHNFFSTLSKILESARDSSEDWNVIWAVFRKSRNTKQRVYVMLPADHRLLKKLREVLMAERAKSSAGKMKALTRLIQQIDRDVLSVSPLEFLARTGL